VKMLRDKKWWEEDELILRDKKVYIPKDKKLRAEMIWLYYNIPVREYEDSGRWQSWWQGIFGGLGSLRKSKSI